MTRWLIGALSLCTLVGCSDPSDDTHEVQDAASTEDATSTEDAASTEDAVESGSTAPPMCLWNQAYQENTATDAIDVILDQAQGCYVLIDPFEAQAAADAIPALHAANNTVGCYISVGTCEDWRSDFEAMEDHCTSTEWPEWPGEFFVTDPDGMVPPIKARIDQLATWGCDMVEFDNMDWASDPEQNESFDLDVTPEDAIHYYVTLCDYVHASGMLCMAKSTREGGEVFDGGTFESFSDLKDWWDHDHLQSFLDQGRLGVIFHYDESNCDDAEAWYRERYGSRLAFLCEDPSAGGYRH
jgi:cysteinyl-tRNA synthetase